MGNRLDIVFNTEDEFYGIYVNNNLEICNEDTCYPCNWFNMIEKYRNFSEIKKWKITKEGYDLYKKNHKNLPHNFFEIKETEISSYNEDIDE